MKKLYNLSISKILILAVIFISAATVGQSQPLLNEGFTGTTTPTNWTETSVSAGDSWEYGGSVDFGSTSTINDPFGNLGEYAHIDFSDDPDTTSLITPKIDVTALTTPRLTFFYISQTTSTSFSPYNRLIVDYWNGTSWVNITVIDTLTTLGWTEYSFDVTTFTFGSVGTDSVQFRFSAQEGGAAIGGTGTLTFDQDLALDDVTIEETPTCLEPTGVFASTVLDTSITFSWVENNAATQWEIEWESSSNFNAGTRNTSIINTDTFAILNGLVPSTEYSFRVRAICAVGDTSFYTIPTSVFTACPSSFSTPFSEDFNSLTLPNCWSQGAGNSEDWEFQLTDGHIGNVGNQGSGSTSSGGGLASVDDSSPHNTNTTLESPSIDVSGLTAPRLTFFTLSDNEGNVNGNVDFHVDIFDGANWNDSIFFSDTNSLNGTWEQIVIDLTQLTITGPIQIRFVVDENNGTLFDDDRAIDDVVVEETPSCLSPSSLTANSITSNSADLNWTENGTATTWQIEYDSAGFVQGTGNDSIITAKPFAWTGLSSNSTYSFYVRAVCGAGDTSAWVGPFSFTTECQTYTSPYTEAFDTFVPDCWDEAGDGDPFTGPTGIGSGDWRAEEYLNTLANGGGAAINLFSSTDEEWILSPNFDLSVGGPHEALIDAGVTNWLSSAADNMGSDDTVQVLISTDAGVSWTALLTWDVNNQPPTLGQTYTIDLSSYTGTTNTFAIWATDGSVNDIEDYDFHIGNFTIQEIPTPYYAIGTINGEDSLGVADSLNVNCRISGTVTGVDRRGGGYEFALIDLSSGVQEGITVFDFNDLSNYTTPTEGDSIEIYGSVDQFNGLTQFRPDSIIVISSGNATVPTPILVTDLDETTESKLVELNDNFVLLDPSGSFSYNMDATNGIDTITIRVDSDTDVNDSLNVTGNALIVGDTICGLIGIGGQFDNSSPYDEGYQVFPSRYSDITICRLACIDPTALSSSNVSSDSASLNWTANGAAINWEISYGATGFTAGNGTQVIANSNPFDLLNLSPNTAYDWYVRSICGVGDTSNWSDTASFTTLATPLPYYPIGTINNEDSTGVADSLSVNCITSGTVTGVDRRGGGYEFALIDLSSGVQEGITVFDFNDLTNYTNPTEGDSLEVYGSVDQFNGLTQFRPDSIVVITSATATVPTPIMVTDLDETTESKLVELNDDFVLLDPSGSFSYNMDATNGIDTITIRVDSETDVDDSLSVVGNELVVGDTICGLIGIGGQFDGSSPFTEGYQVFPSRYSDLTICRLPVGLNDVKPASVAFSIVPNPTSGDFTIRTDGFNNESVRIQIRDISGRIITNEILSNANNQVNKTMNLNGNSKGIYFINIYDGENVIHKKLILK